MRIGLESSLLPYGRELFSSLGEVGALADPRIDACVVRASQRVDAEFLRQHPSLRWVLSATSGEDHIHRGLLSDVGVKCFVARGCNAEAVADWVELALQAIGKTPSRLGVVGVGHVGSAVARRFACEIECCDPPKAQKDPMFKSTSLEEVFAKCDVVTIHVPLLTTTRDFITKGLLERLGEGTLINAARGEVLVSEDAIEFASGGGHLCLDVFPREPNVNIELIRAAQFATPHVAGHTVDAKNKGLEMCARWLACEVGATLEGRAVYSCDPRPPGEILADADRCLRAGEGFSVVRGRSLRPSLPRGGQGGTDLVTDRSSRIC